MAAHSMIADKKSGVPKDVLQAIRAGGPIPVPRLAALFALANEMVKTHGQPAGATVRSFLDAGYQERHLLYVVLAIAVKTLSNYSNHAFATAVDERFAAYKVG
jgi:alkylhydroperoxidase family enzyme